MKTRTHTRTGLTFTELGFGTAPIGGLYRPVAPDDAQATMTRAWDLGVRYFDTAPLYGLGQSETRLNRALQGRSGFITSSKVGRLLRPTKAGEAHTGVGKWFSVPSRVEIYDYSYDGVMRSVEFSLERTGLDRFDILYVHDLDLFTHKTLAALDPLRNAFMQGGYKALIALRDQGMVTAIGGGINESAQCEWLMQRGDFDIFLLAGRYTLLQQDSLDSFLPAALKRGIGIVVGGPYNSGILATGAKPGAFYNYDLAPPDILARVARIEAVCKAHDTPLTHAAFQFPLRHPAILSIIPGAQTPAEVEANARAAAAEIPPGLWADLKSQSLLHPDAPT